MSGEITKYRPLVPAKRDETAMIVMPSFDLETIATVAIGAATGGPIGAVLAFASTALDGKNQSGSLAAFNNFAQTLYHLTGTINNIDDVAFDKTSEYLGLIATALGQPPKKGVIGAKTDRTTPDERALFKALQNAARGVLKNIPGEGGATTAKGVIDVLLEKKKVTAVQVTVSNYPEQCRYKQLPNGKYLLKEIGFVKWKTEGQYTGDIAFVHSEKELIISPYPDVNEYDFYTYAGVTLEQKSIQVEMQLF